MGIILQVRVFLAVGLSLLLHLAVLSIPIGRIGNQVGFSVTLTLPDKQDFAPLSVLLATYVLQQAPQQVLPAENKLNTLVQVTASIDTDGGGVGTPASGMNRTDSPALNEPASLAGLPIPYYYRPQELNQRARIINDINPNLDELKDSPGAGKAVISLWINESGGVDRTEIEKSELSETFEKAVLKQFLSARFQPAEREGILVKSLMQIEVEILPR